MKGWEEQATTLERLLRVCVFEDSTNFAQLSSPQTCLLSWNCFAFLSYGAQMQSSAEIQEKVTLVNNAIKKNLN